MKSTRFRRLAAEWTTASLAPFCALGCSAVDPKAGEHQTEVAVAKAPVTFGDVNWQEYGDLADGSQQRRWADATGFLENAAHVDCGTAGCTFNFSYDIDNYNDTGNFAPLCASEIGADQPVFDPGCTVLLVGPQTVVTAGHCIGDSGLTDCTNLRVVFGLTVSNGQPRFVVPETDVYSCTTMVTRGGTSAPNDYAVFKLDRPVSGRIPMWIRRGDAPSVGQALTSISYPASLPMKIDANGAVKSVDSSSPPRTLTENSDTAVGSSGSPLINPANGVVDALNVESPPGGRQTAFIVQNPGTQNECLRWFPCSDNTGCPGFNTAQLTSTFHQYVPLHPAGIIAAL